jgi:Holliday junction resolvase
MNQETKIQRAIMLALSEAGCLVFRNETSGAWVGKKIHQAGQQVTLTDARMIRFGLCVGSSDLIGLTPEGTFLAIEVKTATGKATKEQLNFIEQVRKQGGKAGIARSAKDALGILFND